MKAISQHLERPFDRILMALISIYQKRISPRKGWRCAYSKLHGGTGCSGFVREAIASHGHRAAYAMARERFRECKQASLVLRAQRQDALDAPDPGQYPLGPGGPPPSGPRRRYDSGDCSSDITSCDTCSSIGEIFSFCVPDNCHIGSCDCDCGGCSN